MSTECFPNKKDFLLLSKKEKLIPVFTKFPLKKCNPADIYQKLKTKGKSFLLDSGNSFGKTARWSFIGAEPFLIFRSRGRRVEIIREPEGRKKRKRKILLGDPLSILQKTFSDYKTKPGYELPPFFGGAVGYFTYDMVHFFEEVPQTTTNEANYFDCYFIFVKTVTAIDHRKGEVWLITNIGNDKRNLSDAYGKGARKLSGMKKDILKRRTNGNFTSKKIDIDFLCSNYTFQEYREIVKKAKKYIKKGDIYQANLSQRFKVTIKKKKINAFSLYLKLRRINPSPFACFFDFPGIKIISSSPERLIKVFGGIIETRPIAGTRPRGKNRDDDKRMEKELILNNKERAEHIMLVDLERNDLGRVCKYGTIKINELMVLEKYSHVIHIVSNIRGHLLKGKDAFDCVRACFPGGTITGVPKVRCMEIIDELEKHRRGPYTGSAGYFCFNGDMDMNILIRTFALKGNNLYFQAGGGIVADSVPEKEYEETLHKAQALFQALSVNFRI